MQAAEYDLMRAVEDRHWWHAVLRSLVVNALSGRLPAGARLLDAGCGTGGMLEFLQAKNGDLEMTGVDAADAAVSHCHQRGLASVQLGSVEALPFADAAFDAVLSLDVLYHAGVSDDRALVQMARVLRPDGLLVLNLPAFEELRGAHDVAVSGARRYAEGEVRALLDRCGFVVENIHYWNAWLFLPLLVWRHLSRLKGSRAAAGSDLALTPGWMHWMLAGMGRVDAEMCREFRLPFGSSVFAVARKIQLPAGGKPDGRY